MKIRTVMSFCDTTCTYTFFSVRHDKIWVCEGREWTVANVCLFSQPCDKYVRQLLFLLLVDNYMIPDESAYSLLFVSGSCLFAEENEPKPYKLISQFCADNGNCRLLILIMFIYLFQNCLQN